MIIAHLLKLPSSLQAKSFATFAADRYLPALHTGSTREGQVVSARLLRRHESEDVDPPDYDRHFLLLVEWSGLGVTHLPRIDDPAVEDLFNAYSAEVVPLGCFASVAAFGSD